MDGFHGFHVFASFMHLSPDMALVENIKHIHDVENQKAAAAKIF